MSKKNCNCRVDAIEVVEVNVGPRGIIGPKGDKGEPGKDGASNWDDITGKPETFPSETHTHDVTEIVGLKETLDNLNPFARIEVLDTDPVAPEAGQIWILRGGN